MTSRYVVAQLGARMHYGVPRMLARAGMLERLYTDLYAGPAIRRGLSAIPTKRASGRLLTRHSTDLPDASVVAFPVFGIRYAARLRLVRNESERWGAYLWAGSKFANLVCSAGLGSASAVYAYNDTALEILRAARTLGLTTVLEQTIAPLAIEFALLETERAKFSDWEPPSVWTLLSKRCVRQREEWAEADLIICGSDFVADGIRQEGGPMDRCRVIPYGVGSFGHPSCSIPPLGEAKTRNKSPHTPLHVLTVGAVGLRKGTPYVVRAAREMGKSAQFRILGPIHLAADVRSEVGNHVQLLGAVPRNEIQKHYEWADVFLLPSLCEGSATSTYEALTAGLPVICTPNTGSAVTDGVDGFIVPATDHRPIVECLTLLSRPGKLQTMSEAAIQTSHQLTLDAYARRLLAVLQLGS